MKAYIIYLVVGIAVAAYGANVVKSNMSHKVTNRAAVIEQQLAVAQQ